MLCGKLHCKKGFNLIVFSYKIAVPEVGVTLLLKPEALNPAP